MGTMLSTLDLVIFFGSLIAVMAIGLWAGRKEETSTDFYLAGKQTRWWGVAGSIFGSNVSANHMVGMMGVGFMYGFAQSHFEITAIAGMLLLCYVFLPMYRKLNLFTLSEYLALRYDDKCRVAYALIMVTIMVVIQMVPGFYIGSRSVNLLLQGYTGAKARATAVVGSDGVVQRVEISGGGFGYDTDPTVVIGLPPGVRDKDSDRCARAVAQIADGKVVSIELLDGGRGYRSDKPPSVGFRGGSSENAKISPGDDVDPTYYTIGIIIMAIVTGTYTIVGGLRAVIITDVVQSILLLGAGLLVAFITFSQPEVGGWLGMVQMDNAMAVGQQKLHLYNSIDHPSLPWTGVLTGLMVLHVYYWGTNQFIVQRALSARTDGEARLGILSAGFFKLLIPFFSIGTGIAASFFFAKRGMDVAQDVVFVNLLTTLIVPLGFGLVGLIAAGMIGAILSSLDSMMNSAATIFTFDIYKRFINPEASERRLIAVGRIAIVVFIAFAAYLTIVTMGANSEGSFFLHVASHQSKLIAGVVVAFVLGMLWKKANSIGALASIVLGVVLSYSIEPFYVRLVDSFLVEREGGLVYTGLGGTLVDIFGQDLNFFHAVFLVALLCTALHILLSLIQPADQDKAKYTWIGSGVFQQASFQRTAWVLVVSLGIYAVLAVLMVVSSSTSGFLQPMAAAWIAAVWTFLVFAIAGLRVVSKQPGGLSAAAILHEDRFLAGLLAALAIFMMFYFY